MHGGHALSGSSAKCQSFSILLLDRTNLLMMRPITLLLGLVSTLHSAVVIDRMAVIVDKRVIKSSDIYRDLEATQFLNRETPNFSVDARRKAADRLIEQS